MSGNVTRQKRFDVTPSKYNSLLFQERARTSVSTSICKSAYQ